MLLTFWEALWPDSFIWGGGCFLLLPQDLYLVLTQSATRESAVQGAWAGLWKPETPNQPSADLTVASESGSVAVYREACGPAF